MTTQDEILFEFIAESRENLELFTQSLLALERNPDDVDLIDKLFRTIHTIKGNCGFLGFEQLESVAHGGETLLNQLRNSELKVESDVTDALLGLSDAVSEIMGEIAASGNEGEHDHSKVIEDIASLVCYVPSSADPKSVPKHSPASVRKPTQAQPSRHAEQLQQNAIRVDIETLDRIMNLVGELVLTRNQLIQHSDANRSVECDTALHQLSSLTSELQGHVMRTRMQPIDSVWQGFHRVVRDTSRACGKVAELFLSGEGTELDKSQIEAIKDPMVHLIRNALDHGIEDPDTREALGKSAIGRIELRAYHEGGLVNVEISDDGAGIDIARLRERVVDKGILTSEQVGLLSEQDICQLIFLPGLTTAEQLSNISGRGVGMDVVKTNIERIGGSIDIESEAFVGTRFSIRIPLTLAIVPTQIVSVEGRLFTIPQVNVSELLRLNLYGEGGIERIWDAGVFRLRGELLPLLFLSEILALSSELDLDNEALESIPVVVIQAGAQRFGLVVDAVHDAQEIVVKPLPAEMAKEGIFAGATILDDGVVSLILDVVDLARRAGLSGNRTDQLPAYSMPEHQEDLAPKEPILIIRDARQRRYAMPLGSVARLERVRSKQLERTLQGPVIRYRDGILPLVRLDDILPGNEMTAPSKRPTTSIVVIGEGSGTVGLVVDDIEDIIYETLAVDHEVEDSMIRGTAILLGHVADVLDYPSLLKALTSHSHIRSELPA